MTLFKHAALQLSRRDLLRLSTAGVVGTSVSGWLGALAQAAADPLRKPKKACILLWMNGGPSQLDTFDPKPGHANGGPFQAIATNVPGIQIAEHLPKVAQWMDQMVVIRSMTTKEADHGRATYLMRTGQNPGQPVQYPSLGSVVAKELGRADAELPDYVSIAPFRFLNPDAYGPGFLGPAYAPLVVGEANDPAAGPQQRGGGGRSLADLAARLQVKNLMTPAGVDPSHAEARLRLQAEMDQEFLGARPGLAAQSHATAYARAVRLMRSAAAQAFQLDDEPDALREAYGRNLFGQGCLLARRLVERGVPFVEVTLSGADGTVAGPGWDTHADNFEQVRRLCGPLDTGWATLLDDLKLRGLLDSTLVVWMGEFGRTPKINPQRGRDHWSASWSTVLAGGGIKGGQVVGRTSADGMSVEDRPVTVADFLATVCLALGIDYRKQNLSNLGRPIRIVDKAEPIKGILP